MTRYNTESCGDEEAEKGEKLHEDEVLHNAALAKGESGSEVSGNGIGADAPASTGQIYNVFTEEGYNPLLPRYSL